MASLMFTISNGEAADIRSFRAGFSAALATAINRVPVINVEQRIQSGAEFSETLQVYLAPRS